MPVLMPLLLLPLLSPPAELQSGARELMEEARSSSLPLERVAFLADRVGPRLAGSEALDQAIRWGLATLQADGLDAHLEEVMVPRWVRGREYAREIGSEVPLEVWLLGGSVGTPPGGIEAEVMVVSDFDELEKRKSEVPGKIVLFDDPFRDYGQAVAYRARGAIEAARRGGVAALVRSPAPLSLATLHTGGMGYEEGVPRVPGVAVTIEDAARMHRLARAGVAVRVRLELSAETLPDVPSANVVGEVRGRERPKEIVILACHLDSWDKTRGAQDDAAGCGVVMEAGRLLARRPPRRTVRVVLFTNEENGLRGGHAYLKAHEKEIPKMVAALEVDLGSGAPSGFGLSCTDPKSGKPDDAARARILGELAPYASLLEPVGAGAFLEGGGGSDISPLSGAGVPSWSPRQDTTGYWPVHHTLADTVDKIDPEVYSRLVAATVGMAWILAEAP